MPDAQMETGCFYLKTLMNETLIIINLIKGYFLYNFKPHNKDSQVIISLNENN